MLQVRYNRYCGRIINVHVIFVIAADAMKGGGGMLHSVEELSRKRNAIEQDERNVLVF